VTVVGGSTDPRLSDSKRRLVLPILLIVAGSLCLFSGIATFVVGAVSDVSATSAVDAPATISVNAHAGDYYVYQQVGSQSGGLGFSVSSSGLATLDRAQVVVTDPRQARVPTWSGDGSETITEGSTIYANAVGFHVSTPGVYKVTIGRVSPQSMIVGPSIGGALAGSAPWLFLCLPGLAGVASGGILLLLGQRRRRRFEATMALAYPPQTTAYPEVPAGSPPPGWYSDPSGSLAWRWWDGRAWTSHTAARDRPQ
jgi:Protein of unknown function (DUF2510)